MSFLSIQWLTLFMSINIYEQSWSPSFLVQGVPKIIRLGFCLISRQPSIGFLNRFFLLKTEIHTQILNTKPFLCDIWGPRYLQNKMRFWNRSIHILFVSNPESHFVLKISRPPNITQKWFYIQNLRMDLSFQEKKTIWKSDTWLPRY